MPTSTFFNLPPEKRERLIQSAEKEFSRVPLEQASINKIVQDAGISRGSFYMYFENKNDLLAYLLKEKQKAVVTAAEIYLKQSNGDPFQAFTDIFQYIAKEVFPIDESLHSFFIHNSMLLFSHDPLEDHHHWHPPSIAEISTYLERYIDMEQLKLKDKRDLELFLEILYFILRRSLIETFWRKEPFEEILCRLERRLELLKYGVLRQDDS